MINTQKIIDEAGSETILFAHKATLLLKNNQLEDALALCQEGLKRFPYYAEGHFVLARCLQEEHRVDDAITEYEKTLYYSPDHYQALKALADLNFDKGNTEQAHHFLKKAFLFNPLDEQLVEQLISTGLYEGAQEHRFAADEAGEDMAQEDLVLDDQLDLPEEDLSMEHLSEEISTEFSEQYQPDSGDDLYGQGQEEKPVDTPAVVDDEFYEETTDQETDLEAANLIENGLDENEPAVAAEHEPGIPEEAEAEFGVLDESELEEEEKAEEDFLNEPPTDGLAGIGEDEEAGEEARDDIGSVLEDFESSDVTEEEKSEFEMSNIVDHVAEEDYSDTKTDLNQFNNTDDDFSTLMDGLFQPGGDTELKEADKQAEADKPEERETELFAEERPVIDTALIFNEKKKTDAPDDELITERELIDDFGLDDSKVEDFNTVAEDIEKMPAGEPELTTDGDAEEKSIQEEEAPAEIPQAEEKTPQAKDRDDSELEFNGSQAALLDDESVKIEDILENPSLLTPTFGEILIAQKKFQDARQVFVQLSKREPDNVRFKKKIEFLDKIVSMNK